MCQLSKKIKEIIIKNLEQNPKTDKRHKKYQLRKYYPILSKKAAITFLVIAALDMKVLQSNSSIFLATFSDQFLKSRQL